MNSPMNYEAYCFDLDGTIYKGNQLLPGARQMIEQLKENNKRVIYITNSPIMTREDAQFRLKRLGIETEKNEIITAPYLAASYFVENEPDAAIFIVGERAIQRELENVSMKVTRNPLEATHVLVGLDRSFTYKDLHQAMDAVRHCGNLIVTNPDPACPIPGGYMPDTMSIGKAIEVASGQKINQIIGKPGRIYGNKIKEILQLPTQDILVIGDSLETDIQLGINHQFKTCLVLTGVSTRENLQTSLIKPDYIIDSLTSWL